MSWAPKPSADGFRYFNQWAGNPKGTREDVTRCIEEVHGEHITHFGQCSRKRGHGPDGLYCKQHDPEAVKARAAQSAAAFSEKMDRINAPRRRLEAYEKALKQIAEGANDARAVALEALDFERVKP